MVHVRDGVRRARSWGRPVRSSSWHVLIAARADTVHARTLLPKLLYYTLQPSVVAHTALAPAARRTTSAPCHRAGPVQMRGDLSPLS